MNKIKQYLIDNYELSEIHDIATHGCSGGVGGLIYYWETVKFHDDYEAEIWDLLYEQAEEFGHKNVIEFIGTFNGAKDVGNMNQFKNLLTWAAVEHFAREIENEKETE